MRATKETTPCTGYRRNLSRNALVLVFVPALISTLFLLGMNQLWLGSENIAEREYRYTDSVIVSFEVINDLLNYNAASLSSRWTRRKDMATVALHSRESLEQNLTKLTQLTAGDPVQEPATRKLIELARKGLDVSKVEELQPQTGQDLYTRNINQAKQALAMAVNGFICSRKAMEIVRFYEERMPQLRQEQEKFQSAFRNTLIGGFVGSFAIMLAILFAFDRQIRRKLRALMNQARSLASLESPDPQAIPGDGELEYLSRSLAEIRMQLKEAAERRAAIVQMVAHDVRSPLMAGQLSIDLVAKLGAAEMSAAAKEKLAEAKRNVSSIIGLVTELLSNARKDKADESETKEATTTRRCGVTFGITQKVLLIAIAPLILQTCWLSWINIKISEVEDLTKQAQQQRDFMLALSGLTLSGLEAGCTHALHVATNRQELIPIIQDSASNLRAYLLKLKVISADDPLKRNFISRVEPFIASSERVMKQFSQSDKVFKEIGNSLERLKELNEISNDGTDRARDQRKVILAQQAVLDVNRERHKELAVSVQQVLTFAIGSTLLLAGLLLALFLENVTRRVGTLTNNIKRMASPNSELIALRGRDELHDLNEVLLSAYRQLQDTAAQRLAVTSALTDKMRQPLEASLQHLQELEKQVPESEVEELQAAIANVQRVLDLIRDLMDIRLIETGQIVLNKSVTPVSSLVSNAVASTRALAENKGIELVVEVTPSVEMAVDERRLVQVLTNIIANAIKFSPERTAVSITATSDRIEVSDQGPGIPSELAERIFDSRFQAKPDGKGFGLGLAIAKAIVDAHGGSIVVKPVQPTGTTFAVVLPESHIDGESSVN